MMRRRRQCKKRIGAGLLNALSVLGPVGKGATLGMAKALGHRAVKMDRKRPRVQLWVQLPLVPPTEYENYSKRNVEKRDDPKNCFSLIQDSHDEHFDQFIG